MQAVASKLREKIQAGIFDDELCQFVEAAVKSGADSALAPLLQKLTATELQLTSPKQSAALVKYLTRLGPLVEVKDYHGVVLSMLDTDNLDLIDALAQFVRRVGEWDVELPRAVVEKLLGVGGSGSSIPTATTTTTNLPEQSSQPVTHHVPPAAIIMAAVEHSRMRTFFSLASSCIQSGELPTIIRALELLGVVGHAQGPNLHEIAQTPLIPSLLSLLEETDNATVLLLGMMIILMYIPWLLAVLPSWLSGVFGVVRRAVVLMGRLNGSGIAAASSAATPATSSVKSPPTSPPSHGGNGGSGALYSPTKLSPPLSPTLSPTIGPRSRSRSSSDTTTTPPPPQHLPTSSSASSTSSPSVVPPPSHAATTLSPSSSATSLVSVVDAALVELPVTMQPTFERCTVFFVKYLHSLYPCNLFNFLKAESAGNATFKTLIRPIVSQLRMSAMLLEADAAQELSLDRWRHINPAHLAVDDFLWEFQRALLLQQQGDDAAVPPQPSLYEEARGVWSEYARPPASTASESAAVASGSSSTRPPPPQASRGSTATATTPLSFDEIARLQSDIERAVVSRSTSTSADSSAAAVPTSFAALSISDLQTMVVLQRNQLLFEKFIHHQLSSRMVSLFKQSSNEDALQAEQAALLAKLEQFRQREEHLYRKWREAQDHVSDLREQNRKLHLNFTMQQNKLLESNRALAAEAEQTRADMKQATDELAALKQAAARKEDTILRLNARVTELSSMVHEQDSFRKRINALKEDIVMWEMERRQVHTRVQDTNALRTQLEQQAEAAAQTAAALEREMSKVVSLNAKLEEAAERVIQVKADNRALHQSVQQLTDLLEYQKTLVASRVAAIQDKYQTVRQINVGYEKHIMELQVELERYKQFAMGLTEPSSSPISIPSAKPTT